MIQQPILDPADLYGLQGALNQLIGALNMYAEQSSVQAVSGSLTLTDLQALGGVLVLTGAPGAGFNLTLPTTSDWLRRPSNFVPMDGTYQYTLRVVNETGQTATLVAGDASTTITGTATVATSTARLFLVTFVSGVAVTVRNIGAQSL